jgi:hypothetical protein
MLLLGLQLLFDTFFEVVKFVSEEVRASQTLILLLTNHFITILSGKKLQSSHCLRYVQS